MTQPLTPLSQLPNFDPRNIPVVGIDAHLPAVRATRLSASALQQRFSQPPEWQPEVRAEIRFADRTPMHAAVLVPLVMRDEPTVLLTERTAHLSTHSGQIAFPGGKVEPGDADAVAAALREAEEEVGLAPELIEVLGLLPDYLTGSAFRITPVVALVRPDYEPRPNPHEVADLFEVPLA